MGSGIVRYDFVQNTAPMILQCLGVNRSQTLKHRTDQLNTYGLNLKGVKEELHIFPIKR